MSQPLRWGILGTGMIAAKFAHDIKQSDRAQLTAVGSRTIESAKRFVHEHGGRPLASYDDLLAADDVDAVYLSLPNGMHHEWTIKTLRAGKDILCEKPFACDVAQAREMFHVAETEGRTVIEAFMYRTHPAVKKLIETAHSGAIGEIRTIRSNFTFSRPFDPNDARYSAEQAGGSIMDVGTYCVNLTRAITQAEPTSVHAIAHKHKTGVDDYAAGTLDFDGRVVTTFTCGMCVNGDNHTYINGSDGYIEVDNPWTSPHSAFNIVKDGKVERIEIPNDKPLYALEAEAFADTIQNGAPPWITPADTIGNMTVLDQLRKSAGIT